MRLAPRFIYLILILAAIVMSSCSLPQSGNAAPEPPVEQTPTTAASEEELFINTYTVTLDVEPVNRYITGAEKVKYKNQTGTDLEYIYFSLNLNAFRPGVRPKPYLAQMEDKIFENGVDYGYIDVQNVTVNRDSLAYETYGAALKITLPEPLPKDDEIEIVLQFEAYIPKISHRTGANDYALWCGNFLPVLSVYGENGWRAPSYYAVGDPFCTDIANFNVTINTPEGYTVAATGIEDETLTPEGQTTAVNVRLVRDFAFAVSKNYTKSTLTLPSGVEINMYTYSRDIDTKRFLDTAGLSLDYFGGVISNYPYRQLDIAETGMFVSGGMEYPQLIFMDSNYLHTDASLKNLAHQICHQWFYNIVGNNQITEAWLDEGLVSYLQEGVFLTVGEIDEKMVSDYKRLETALPDIKNKALAADLGAYTAWADYYNIQYVRGKLMFYSLNKKMGSDAFDEFLRLYYSRYSYKIAGAAELRQTAEEVYGGGLTDFFEAWTQNADLPAL